MDIVRWWKDPEFRATNTPPGPAGTPAHPAGLVELDDAVMAGVVGAATEGMGSMGCCAGFTAMDTFCVGTGCGCTGVSVCDCSGGMATCTACTA